MAVNNKNIGQILEDLYRIDPKLKSREQELTKLVVKLMAAAPTVKVDQAFVKRLRDELMKGQAEPVVARWSGFKMSTNLSYAYYGALVMMLFVVLGFGIMNRYAPSSEEPVAGVIKETPKTVAMISKVGEAAFGSLGVGSNTAGVMTEVSATGRGGGGGTSASSPSPVADAKMIMPYPMTNYRYLYNGEVLTALADKQEVLKRVKMVGGSANVTELIAQLGMGSMDLGVLGSQQLQNLTLVGRQDFGYITNINLDEGLISIYQNWETWPAGKCGSDTACFEAQRVQLSDLEDQSAIIAVADQVIKDYEIDMTNYEAAEINNDWRRYYDQSEDKASYYLPEAVEVVYPLKINGRFVYDEWSGAKLGLSITVNPKLKKMVSVNNLVTHQYEASMYDMETDMTKILAAAGNNPGMIMYDQGRPAETVDLELINPEEVYVKVYVYRDNRNQELLVPALRFAIANRPKDLNFYRQSVVVPLAKEILAERLNMGGDRPMLMDQKPAVMEGASNK